MPGIEPATFKAFDEEFGALTTDRLSCPAAMDHTPSITSQHPVGGRMPQRKAWAWN